ncbi:Crp/Fnr family transcriptional regulator [Chryseobacterium sp. 2R14A]|uniref:Crp/Fnr family transcriptional regulator n=1 Tax=Chryseobacterium sp. 2R14A TaxID=3380353 RepID=UPI003CEFDA2A
MSAVCECGVKHYKSGEIIFHDGDKSGYFYQIVRGTVKLCSCNHHIEILHTVMNEGQSFGDFLLFTEKPYPTTAVVIESCEVLRLCTINFFGMLDIYPQLYRELFKSLS